MLNPYEILTISKTKPQKCFLHGNELQKYIHYGNRKRRNKKQIFCTPFCRQNAEIFGSRKYPLCDIKENNNICFIVSHLLHTWTQSLVFAINVCNKCNVVFQLQGVTSFFGGQRSALNGFRSYKVMIPHLKAAD